MGLQERQVDRVQKNGGKRDYRLEKVFPAWPEARRGKPGDLGHFYSQIVRAIREIDPDTPILVGG